MVCPLVRGALMIGHFWLPVHRFMLLTEVLVTTIILHVRPYNGYADDSDLGYFVNCLAIGMLYVTILIGGGS
jgi:hypothetical protein